MESQYQHLQNGQSVLESDLNLMGRVAALADDCVFAELFRMQPYDGSTVRRGIMTYAHAASGATALVAPNGASGSVLVSPFRGVIGSRTAVGTDAKKNWRDIRSAISVGSTTLTSVVSFGANASGNPRWDLVYAIVTVDGNGASVTRKVKDPVTKAITGSSIVTTLVTSAVLAVQPGTAAASPSWPAAPSDSGNTYVVPIAYVRIPNGFGAGSTVLASDIAEAFSPVTLSRATGAASFEVANQHYQAGAIVTAAQIQAWGASGAASRPFLWMPPSMTGCRIVALAINFAAIGAPASDSVFDSRDWRGFITRTTAAIGQNGAQFAWAPPSLAGGVPNGVNQSTVTANAKTVVMMGQTLADDGALASPLKRTIANFNAADVGGGGNPMNSLSSFIIYCDHTDGGKLKVRYSGSPSCTVFAIIEFFGMYDNA